MKVDTNKLRTIKNYAMENKVTAAYIYKLIAEKRMQPVVIDGVQFVDIAQFPKLPTR